jgi:glycosyltransferase involved in cell wall biosynthesis
VHVLDQGSNRGQGLARNLGASHASGDWVYFFDSDDLASPRLVEIVSNQCAAGDQLDVILFGGEPFLDADIDREILQRIPSYQRPQLGRFHSLYEATEALDARAASYVSPCLYVVSNKLLRSKSLAFPADYHEDDNFYLDLVAHASESLVLPDVLFERRIRAGSVTTSPKTMKHLRGYLGASSRARRHSRHQPEANRRQYFQRKAIEYYLQAMALSGRVQGENPYKWVFARLLALPTWKLTRRQYAAVLSAGRSQPLSP